MDSVLGSWHVWAWSSGSLILAVTLALVADWILFSVLRRLALRNGIFVQSLVRHGRTPSLFILPIMALLTALPIARLPANAQTFLERAVGLGLIAAIGWMVITFSAIVFDLMSSRY